MIYIYIISLNTCVIERNLQVNSKRISCAIVVYLNIKNVEIVHNDQFVSRYILKLNYNRSRI